MAIEFDVTKISLPEENTYIKNEKGEDILNGLTEVMIILTMFIGIKDITEKNYKDFHKRVKEFEVASGMKGMLIDYSGNGKEGTEGKERKERMPTLEEVKWHIGLKTNSEELTKRKWHSNIKRMVTETANDYIKSEVEVSANLVNP